MHGDPRLGVALTRNLHDSNVRRRPPFQTADTEWFDAMSSFRTLTSGQTLSLRISAGVEPLASLKTTAALGAVPELLPAAELQTPGPHVPDPPLVLADREFLFVPVPADVSPASSCCLLVVAAGLPAVLTCGAWGSAASAHVWRGGLWENA